MSDFYDNQGNYDPAWKEGTEYIVSVEVDWDTDNYDGELKDLGLASVYEMVVDVQEEENENDVEEYISDYIDKNFDYCTFGFDYVIKDKCSFDYKADECNFGVVETNILK